MDNRKKNTKVFKSKNPKSTKLLSRKYETTVGHYVFSIKQLFESIVCYLFLPANLTEYVYSSRLNHNWLCLHNLGLVCRIWHKHIYMMQAFLSDVLIFVNATNLKTLPGLTVKNLCISKTNLDTVVQFASTLKRCHFNYYRLSVDLLMNLKSKVLEEIAGVFIDHQNVIDSLHINLPNLNRGSFAISRKILRCAFENFEKLEEITMEGAFDNSNVLFKSNEKLKTIILSGIQKLTLQNNTNLQTLHCWSVCDMSFDHASVENLKSMHAWYFPCWTLLAPSCKNIRNMFIDFPAIDEWITNLTTLQSLIICDIRKQYLKNGKNTAFAMIPPVKKLRLKSSKFEFFNEFLMLFNGRNLEILELDCKNNHYNLLYSKQKNQKAVCEKFPNLKAIVFYNLHTKIQKSTVFHNANIDVSIHFDK